MTTPTDVPLLTAEDVAELSSVGMITWVDQHRKKLRTIATERARVCPVRTEAEWRDAWRNWYRPDRVIIVPDQVISVTAWLAALRHLNLVAPENGK